MDFFLLLSLVSLFSSSVFFYYYYLTLVKPTSNPRPKLPPGPKPWPLIGNVLQLGELPHKSLAQMARTHGPLISLKLGTQLLIVASTPSAASQVLMTHDRILSARYIPQTYRINFYISHSLAFSFDCNDRWKTLRTLCKTELFTTRMLDLQAHLRQNKVGELVESLFSSRGEVFNLGELVFGTLLNIMGNMVFSRDVFDLGDKKKSGLRHNFSRFLELAMAPNLADFYPWLARMDVQKLNREAIGIAKEVYGVWEGFLRERGRGNDKRRDFVDVLKSAGCSDTQIKALCAVCNPSASVASFFNACAN